MASKLKQFLLIFSLWLIPASALAAMEFEPEWNLSDYEIKKIEDGRVVSHTASVGEYSREIRAYLYIKAPAEDVFSAITDYEHLHEFMPNLVAVDVLESKSSGALVNYELELPFGVEKRYRLQLGYDSEPYLQLTWKLVAWQGLDESETIADTTGYWQLRQLKNSNETLLVYYNQTDPGKVPFGLGWIVDFMTDRSVVELLNNTKKRVEKRWLEQNKS